MSWTIKPPTDAIKKKAFDDVVHNYLTTRDILMLYAASSIAYKVPNATERNCIFSGHELVVDRSYEDVYDTEFQTFEAHSGSAAATALAVRLAALIIECIRLGVLCSNEAN
ncbi:hypothetical protein S7711_01313 [Stachybotrys chartarum IBT 7711]|uniref:Uncharacterized protein n=1 Tax=Stachybotrys chartarum (strain CBS 109288 / IBT 7711) TaxID=1280523 RepID=A0A084BBN5_STACB|nr:hypothetical protein S7711_01313 [Stachybotrys chartarum IBT 7711]